MAAGTTARSSAACPNAEGIAKKMDDGLPPGSGGAITGTTRTAPTRWTGSDQRGQEIGGADRRHSAKKLKAGLAEAQAGMGG
jgi:hypothetical protein